MFVPGNFAGPARARGPYWLLALVGVIAVHQGGEVEHDVLLEVGRTVELTVLVTDDDTNLGRVASRSGLPGLQTDGVVGLGTLDLERVGQNDGGDDVVGLLREVDGHFHS